MIQRYLNGQDLYGIFILLCYKQINTDLIKINRISKVPSKYDVVHRKYGKLPIYYKEAHIHTQICVCHIFICMYYKTNR